MRRGDRPFDLLAIDLDNTLLTSEKRISDRDAAAIRRAHEAGLHIVLATARPPRSTRWVAEELGLVGRPGGNVSIHYNGAVVWDCFDGAHLEHTPLGAAVARRLVTAAREAHADILVDVETLDTWHTDRLDPRWATETARLFRPDSVGPLDAALAGDVTKVMFLGDASWIGPVRARVVREFVETGAAAMFSSDPHILELCAATVDKQAALARVASRLGVVRQRILAFGDGDNDARMLRWAGKGVAVANACPLAKAAASEVSEHTNNESAVGRVIEREVLDRLG